MDGLECRELMLSYVLASSEGGRMDSHFFEKKYEKVISAVKRNNPVLLKNIVEKPIQTGHTPSMKEDRFYGGNIAFIKTNNLREGFITTFFDNYLTDVGNATIARTSLRQGDIITTIIGANEKVVARSALITEEFLPSNINQNIVQIRINKEIIDPEYVYVYLNSFYGKQYLYYYSRQMEQVNLNCDEVGMVEIPIFSKKFTELVTKASIKYNALINKSRQTYAEAERCLLKELGIDMSTISSGGVSVKTFSECFNVQNRIDAEFYQSKYDEILKAIKTYDTDAKTLDEIAKYVFTGECADEYFPYDLTLRHYVRGTDIHDGLVDIDLNYSVEAVKHTKFVSNGDIITGRVGTIGRFGVIPCELDGAVCSDNVLCFHLPDNYQPNVYALYFNSNPIKELTNRMSRGSVQQRLNQETLRELIVPLIKDDIQNEINERIHTSFMLKAKAGQLLECAKAAVEMAIEKDEASAIFWLEEKISELTGEVAHE